MIIQLLNGLVYGGLLFTLPADKANPPADPACKLKA